MQIDMANQERHLDHLVDLLREMEGLDINALDPHVVLQIIADVIADVNETDDNHDSANGTDTVRSVPQDHVPQGPDRRRVQMRNISRRARARQSFERVFLPHRERELQVDVPMMERVCAALQEYLADATAAQQSV